MEKLLRNKVALISGCDQGIGLCICKKFVDEGAIVYANVLKEDSVESIKEECSGYFGKVIPICFDITEKNNITDCIKRIKKEQNGKLNILVNNAGFKKDSLVEMIDDDSLYKMFDVNVFGLIHMTQAALRLMRRTKDEDCSIINISSTVGLRGNNGQSIYGATKGAVASLTKSWSKELASYGIRVNAVAPGSIDTSMFYEMNEKDIKSSIEAIGMKRLGRPDEVADVVLFLASELSSYITGDIIGVTGGLFI